MYESEAPNEARARRCGVKVGEWCKANKRPQDGLLPLNVFDKNASATSVVVIPKMFRHDYYITEYLHRTRGP